MSRQNSKSSERTTRKHAIKDKHSKIRAFDQIELFVDPDKIVEERKADFEEKKDLKIEREQKIIVLEDNEKKIAKLFRKKPITPASLKLNSAINMKSDASISAKTLDILNSLSEEDLTSKQHLSDPIFRNKDPPELKNKIYEEYEHSFKIKIEATNKTIKEKDEEKEKEKDEKSKSESLAKENREKRMKHRRKKSIHKSHVTKSSSSSRSNSRKKSKSRSRSKSRSNSKDSQKDQVESEVSDSENDDSDKSYKEKAKNNRNQTLKDHQYYKTICLNSQTEEEIWKFVEKNLLKTQYELCEADSTILKEDLSTLNSKIISNINDDPQLIQFEMTNNYSKKESFNKILSIIFPRISTGMTRLLQTDQNINEYFIFTFFGALNHLNNIPEDEIEKREVVQAYLVNLSRCFTDYTSDIEDDNLDEMCKLQSLPWIYSLPKNRKSVFDDALKFYHDVVLPSRLFDAALRKTIKSTDQKIIDDYKDAFQSFKVVWISCPTLFGMVGFNGKIYLSYKIFTKFFRESAQVCKSKIIQVLLHEGMHYATRKVKNNFFTLTDAYDDEATTTRNLEGGFRFEYFLWGDTPVAIYRPEYESKFFSKESWDKETPILAEEKVIIHRKHSNIHCSGLEIAPSRMPVDM